MDDLFNDALNTFLLTVIWRWTYGEGHSDGEIGNLLPPLHMENANEFCSNSRIY